MQYFVLNLKRRPDRRRFMTAKLGHTGITDYEFVDAVDQREMRHGRGWYPYMGWQQKCGPAIYASVLKVCGIAIARGLDRFVYLEDDVYFHKRYHELLQAHADTLASADLVYLGHHMGMKPIRSYVVRGVQTAISVPLKYPRVYGSYGWVLSARLARFLLERRPLVKCSQSIDMAVNKPAIRRTFDVAILSPPCIIPEVRDSDNLLGYRKCNLFRFAKRQFGVNVNDYAMTECYREYARHEVLRGQSKAAPGP